MSEQDILPPPAPGLSYFGAMVTLNLTPYRIWITIYDLGKTTHLDYGYLEAATTVETYTTLFYYRIWRSGHYVPPGVYHVRGEVKDSSDSTIFDTIIEITPGDGYLTYIEGDGNGNFWWTQGLPPLVQAPPQQ
jgi:hypothetical protein